MAATWVHTHGRGAFAEPCPCFPLLQGSLQSSTQSCSYIHSPPWNPFSLLTQNSKKAYIKTNLPPSLKLGTATPSWDIVSFCHLSSQLPSSGTIAGDPLSPYLHSAVPPYSTVLSELTLAFYSPGAALPPQLAQLGDLTQGSWTYFSHGASPPATYPNLFIAVELYVRLKLDHQASGIVLFTVHLRHVPWSCYRTAFSLLPHSDKAPALAKQKWQFITLHINALAVP